MATGAAGQVMDMNFRYTTSLTFVLPLLLSGAASAQVRTGSIECVVAVPAGVVVQGRLVADPGEPLSVHGTVRLEGSGASCSVAPNPDGTFEFRGVGAGQYRMSVQMSAEFQRMAPISFTVSNDTLLHFDIPVRWVDPLPDCVKQERCASVLARRTSRELSASSEGQLELTVYRLGIALAGEGWEEEAAWVACFDAPAETVASLEEVYPFVAAASECQPPDPRSAEPGDRRLWRHRPTARPGRMVVVTTIEATSETTARADISYHVAPLWGAWYSCDLERVGQLWTARKCRMTGIS